MSESTCNTTPRPISTHLWALDGFVRTLGRAAWSFFQLLLDWQERTSERHRLAQLEDYYLRDMGLTRADVEQEISKPFWRL